MTESVILETPSLILRPFVLEDAAMVFALSQEEASRRWLPSQVCRDEAHALEVVSYLAAQCVAPGHPAQGPYVLGVRHRADDVLVGHVGLSPFQGGVEIGFSMALAYQRRGLTAEAIEATCRWAFPAFDLPEILGVTDAANEGSRRTLLRAGFAPAGTRQMTFQGSPAEVHFFRRLPPSAG